MELDDLVIIDVEPVTLGQESTLRTWLCASCTGWHDISSGYVIRHHDNGRSRRTYVCGDCARPFLRDR